MQKNPSTAHKTIKTPNRIVVLAQSARNIGFTAKTVEPNFNSKKDSEDFLQFLKRIKQIFEQQGNAATCSNDIYSQIHTSYTNRRTSIEKDEVESKQKFSSNYFCTAG